MLSNGNLARRGQDLGIGTCVFCNEGTVVSAKMIASTLEAIVGAVYLDGGDAAVSLVIEHLGLTNHRLLMVTLKSPSISSLNKHHQSTNLHVLDP